MSEEKFLNQFPFYQKSRQLWTDTQETQIIKGLVKYPEAFNPMSWTPIELLHHALQESVDLVHYLVGLMDHIELLETTVKEQNRELRLKDEEIAHLKYVIAGYKNEAYLAEEKKAKYSDLDD